ncbi:MAG: substrate-binding domain-containing protein, partial [Propionicimonas sp.]|nr:substrate-binding domain-containing protein [Propionicimonas sp.]
KRAKVLKAIDELGFVPSAAARTLSWGRPQLIGVIAGNTSRYGYAETVRGIEEGARSAGFTVTITVVESTEDEEVGRAVSSVLGQSIAGMVVLKFDPPGVAALRRIPASIPTVSVSGVREPGVPQAVLNESAAAREVVGYLLDLGHQTVHHVRVPPSRKEDGRTTGWRRALVERGRAVPPIIDATWQPESGRQIGLALAERPEVTAVFCGNDEIAMGMIRGICETGRSVPGDVSVVGFDDHPLAGYYNPPLTTVRQDFCELGGRAYRMLEAMLQGRPTNKYSSIKPALIRRESAGAPPAFRA